MLVATLKSLENPEGLDQGKDLSSYVEAAQAAAVELASVGIPSEWNAAVPQDVLDVFSRVDAAAEMVMTILRVDDETGRIHGLLGEFRNLAKRAAAAPPTQPDPR